MSKINYLLGYKDLKIYQDEDMFRFSIDSVLLPNFVTINSKCRNILDIGTGNAVIPLILTTKTNAKIDGVEIQKEVFDLGVQSVQLNSLENQIHLYNHNILDFYKTIESDCYDTITCNPPYFKVTDNSILNDTDYKTIARHEVKLNLNDVMMIAKKLLKNNGNIAIVHRTERLIDILETMRKNNIEPKKIQFVYSKQNDNSNIILVEGVKNGNPGIKIMPPLYIYDETGNYSEKILKYFEN